MEPVLTPKRTQYFFDLSGVKYKTRADTLRMQQQWNTFEQVENYNDVIYQRFELGLRDKTYYTFRDREEMNAYRNGQELHILRYPYLPPSTFASIATSRAMPDVVVVRPAPNYSQVPRNIITSTAITASELTEQAADLTVYSHVSTYNAEHVYKYIFASDEEKMAYHRAELRLRLSS